MKQSYNFRIKNIVMLLWRRVFGLNRLFQCYKGVRYEPYDVISTTRGEGPNSQGKGITQLLHLNGHLKVNTVNGNYGSNIGIVKTTLNNDELTNTPELKHTKH